MFVMFNELMKYQSLLSFPPLLSQPFVANGCFPFNYYLIFGILSVYLQEDKFPKNIKHMSGVQWLKLDRTGMDTIPDEMGKLVKLEHLSMKNNQLEKLFGQLSELGCLRSLNVRRNKLKSHAIPSDLFELEELTTLDLSHNRLKEVPEGLEKAKALLVLNLSNNQ